MLKVFKYFRPIEWVELLICVLLIMLCVYSDLKVPDYMSNMTTLLTTPGTTTDDIWGVGIFMIIYSLISFAATIVVILLAARIASGVSFNLRHLEFEAVEGYSMTEINRFSTSSLINRSTNDITQVQFVIALGTMLIVRAPVMCIWAISKIVDKDWHWTATTAVAVVIMLGIMITIVALVFPKFKRIQSLTDDINRLTEENLTGIRVVRAYNAEGYQTEKFEETNTDLTGTMLFSMRTLALLNPVMMLIMNGLTLAVYWVGAGLINAAGMADKYLLFSDMVVFSAYAIQIVMSFLMLVMIFILLPRASVAARRIAEVIETPSSIKDGDRDKGDEDKKGTVEFRNVSFRYADGGANVLSDISFKAEKGETVAIIGSTGSGKSTIINLIPRFYDATEGEVLVDGVNV
ncbi:MAG: ABC transporter ATP-binding protein, partial [Christensenellaceae bacterium]|nr:ABC transporter ATP-binding protein [Christensenellaceae bacterium]